MKWKDKETQKAQWIVVQNQKWQEKVFAVTPSVSEECGYLWQEQKKQTDKEERSPG